MATRVIIVGGGLAGMSAAHTVLEAGGRVIVLDKSPFCGGNSTKATSGINGAGTRSQRARDIPDTPEIFEADTTKSAGARGRPELIRALTFGSGPAVEWLIDAFGLDLSTISMMAAHSHPRTHRAKDGTSSFPGMMITYRLMEALDEVAAKNDGRAIVENKARVTKLLSDGGGTVTGVEYTNKDGAVKQLYGPVIISTGGFGADFSDDSLLSTVEKEWRTLDAWKGVPLPELRTLPTTNGPHCTGDGIKMAVDVGANTADLHCVQVHPTGLIDPRDPDAKVRWLAAEALRGSGGILLDAHGKRFANELGKRDYVSARMWAHGNPPYRLVLNTAASNQISWHCEHYGARGLMRKMSGADLAKEMGISKAELQKTFDAYNQGARDKNDPWGKTFFNAMPASANDDYNVAIVGPVIHYCMGGVEGDAEARVLKAPSSGGGVIPGLFAAGEVLGGVHGSNRLGGSSLLDCVVFGRIAGRSAAKYLLSNSLEAMSSGSAVAGAGASGISARLDVVPGTNKVNLEVSWGAASAGAGAAAPVAAAGAGAAAPVAGAAGAAASAGGGGGSIGKFTAAEVATHNSEDDCWVVIDDKVYDVTKFLADHPGGKAAIVIYAGKDATKEFKMMHKPEIIDKYGAEYLVGSLVGGSGAASGPAPAAATPAAPAAPSSGGGGGALTPEVVAKHNTEDDCWVIVDGKVYDVTKFLDEHPGGAQILVSKGGKDATQEFKMFHKPDVIDTVAKPLYVGDLGSSVDTGGSGSGGGSGAAAGAGAAGGAYDGAPGEFAYEPDVAGLEGSEKESWNSGGTAGELVAERAKASFKIERMTNVIDGGADAEKGADATKRRRFVLGPLQAVDNSDKYNMTRSELMTKHFIDFIGIHKAHTMNGYIPKRDEVVWMSECATNSGSFMPHMGLVLPTLLGQASDEQQMWWLPRALTFQLVGSYAQTELGHGSNVRGLRTTAVYDKETQEFVLNTPTLQSMKWWNSNMGLAATHAVVFAQLMIDGKEYGVHPFWVQVRDEEHRPIAGCEMGDVGPKLGDHAIDTGYLRMKDVRIPRQHLFGKRQMVTPEGKYVKLSKKTPGAEKAHYMTMMQARAGMLQIAGGRLGIAATTATRYSCVRRQGFVTASQDISYKHQERQIIDYGVQQYRIFKRISEAYAIKFTGHWINEYFEVNKLTGDDLPSDMVQIHATTAGLKGLCTQIAAEGIEDLRKACGGHGYGLSSGIAALAADYVWQTTAEGDFIVMLLQTARFVLKSGESAFKGEDVPGGMEYLKPLGRAGYNPVKSGGPRAAKTVSDVMELDFLLKLFEHRALVAAAAAARHMMDATKRGVGYADAFNANSVNLCATSRSHCYHFMLQRMIATMRKVDDAPVRAVLTRLAQVFALTNIVDGQQWAGIVDAATMSLVDDAIAQVLAQLRPDAVAIVDSFEFPDIVLGSALGRKDGNVYEQLYRDATKSRLNQTQPFAGYREHLRPHLDIDYLKLRNDVVPEAKL